MKIKEYKVITVLLKEEKDLKCWNNHPRSGFQNWFSKFDNKNELVIVKFQDEKLTTISVQQIAYYVYQDILIANDTSNRDLSIYVNEIMDCTNIHDVYSVASQETYPATSIENLESITEDGIEELILKYGFELSDINNEDYEDEKVFIFLKELIKNHGIVFKGK